MTTHTIPSVTSTARAVGVTPQQVEEFLTSSLNPFSFLDEAVTQSQPPALIALAIMSQVSLRQRRLTREGIEQLEGLYSHLTQAQIDQVEVFIQDESEWATSSSKTGR